MGRVMETDTCHHIDAKGLLCPIPILRFKKYIKPLAAGEVVVVESTDPDSVKDFEIFTEMKGYTILESVSKDSVFVFTIKI